MLGWPLWALVGAFALLLLLGLWALWALVGAWGAGFWGALAGLGWRSFWGARGCSVCGQGCGGGLVALGLVSSVAGAALFVGLWVLVGTCGLSWFASMWAHVGACLWAEVALAWRARERMWALVGGCDECLWALVSAGAFLMKCCASGCERIQALGRSASLMGAFERTWACVRALVGASQSGWVTRVFAGGLRPCGRF